jgi:acyl carrier protein
MPGARVINEYGPTETVVGCCVYQVGTGEQWPGDVPIGRAIANTQLYVVDASGGLAARGAVGELYVGGAGVARGYLDQPKLTAERFVPDAFGGEPGARLYRTGDRARWRADGQLEFVGRVDSQVKVRGHRIEPGEIEAALIGLSGVREAAVIAREWGGLREKRLVAYLVWDDGPHPSIGELRNQLRERLPEYMVPSAFVELDRLPLTPNGKIDRRALPAPETAGGMAYEAARTPVEEVLCDIWSEVLGVERIGVHDNFFDLGGHSLLATVVAARIRERFGIEFQMRGLFESPSISTLAVLVEKNLIGQATTDEIAAALETLDQLSNDDIKTLLLNEGRLTADLDAS